MHNVKIIGTANPSIPTVAIGLRAKSACVAMILFTVSGIGWSQMAADPPPPILFQSPRLNQVPRSVPDPIQLAQFIQNKSAALRLGKALFWDMQLGSDGFTS